MEVDTAETPKHYCSIVDENTSNEGLLHTDFAKKRHKSFEVLWLVSADESSPVVVVDGTPSAHYRICMMYDFFRYLVADYVWKDIRRDEKDPLAVFPSIAVKEASSASRNAFVSLSLL